MLAPLILRKSVLLARRLRFAATYRVPVELGGGRTGWGEPVDGRATHTYAVAIARGLGYRHGTMCPPGDNHSDREAEAELRRLTRWKGSRPYTPHILGEDAIELFNSQIKNRHAKFGKLSEAWETLVPALFQEHTMLASFVRGVLTVHVDSSPHLYELKQLMLAGLEDQLLLACRGYGLKKLALKRGKLDLD